MFVPREALSVLVCFRARTTLVEWLREHSFYVVVRKEGDCSIFAYVPSHRLTMLFLSLFVFPFFALVGRCPRVRRGGHRRNHRHHRFSVRSPSSYPRSAS